MTSGVRTLSSLAVVARVALVTFVAGCVLTLLAATMVLLPIGGGAGGVLVGLSTGLVSLIWLVAFVICVVTVPLWIHRAHANLHEAGLQGLTYSPAWASASFFVPFANLYVPYASTRELFNRSQGESDWHRASPVGDVTSWYACNWGALVVSVVALGYFGVNAIPGVYVILPPFAWFLLLALIYVLLAGSAWFLLRIVGKVTGAQASGLHLGAADTFD
ncbi:DUF4328 domain-containing protein [Aurantiacibacter luteus]|uniref:DUF4328 domain-containing protein n=1 Tax=Aurantiacibacter luteus TaxID=1581420 RepID=UPI00069B2FEF|nr:DUF4328 domain-containing protein [Aurantiacibacter luteus]